VDLTLVQVDEQRLPASEGIRRMPICKDGPWPGEKVIVAIPEGTARSEVISPALLPPGARGFDTVIKDVATTGNSGSGVFDLSQKCLLGIMSRKIQRPILHISYGIWRLDNQDVAKYFVPASVIRAFIPLNASTAGSASINGNGSLSLIGLITRVRKYIFQQYYNLF
jgi:hypothetical protein